MYFSQDQAARDKALQTMASMSSAQIVSASVLHNKNAPPSNNYNEHYSSPHPGHPLPALPSSQVSCKSVQSISLHQYTYTAVFMCICEKQLQLSQ